MPRLVSGPVNVVEDKNVKISEFFGGASSNPCNGDISVAHVHANAGWAEDWQAPAFDEYVLVLKGSVTIETAHEAPTKVSAGQAVFLAKGERVRWVFDEPAEYVPICLPVRLASSRHTSHLSWPDSAALRVEPLRVASIFVDSHAAMVWQAFSPANVHREEAGAAPPAHDSHTSIYHLVQKPLWEEAKAAAATYYPPTYKEDGFTHATADPKYLIGVANHFYKETKAEWPRP